MAPVALAEGQVWQGVGKHAGVTLKIVKVRDYTVVVTGTGKIRKAYRERPLTVPKEAFIKTHVLVRG